MIRPWRSELLCFKRLHTDELEYAVKIAGVNCIEDLTTGSWELVAQRQFRDAVGRSYWLEGPKITGLIIDWETLRLIRTLWTRMEREALAAVLQDTNALDVGNLEPEDNLLDLNAALFSEERLFHF